MADLRLVDRIDVADLPAGHHETLLLAAVRLGDGSTLQVPVRVAAGRKPGPTLAVVAGVHGDEPDGMAALLNLWDGDCPVSDLTGTLILVAVANPMAFGAPQRRSPIDGGRTSTASFPATLLEQPQSGSPMRCTGWSRTMPTSSSRCTAGTRPGIACLMSSFRTRNRRFVPRVLQRRRPADFRGCEPPTGTTGCCRAPQPTPGFHRSKPRSAAPAAARATGARSTVSTSST